MESIYSPFCALHAIHRADGIIVAKGQSNNSTNCTLEVTQRLYSVPLRYIGVEMSPYEIMVRLIRLHIVHDPVTHIIVMSL